ncbi:ORF6N domain-containing protein [Desulfosarcina sp.]|uniref:ORF6N domain-containing protein n=1 Tax=Desulfosarcina sp. TaxID=2027861 RepID=UPI003970ABE0
MAAIAHEKAGGISGRDAVAAYLRVASFTCLNRFVALKMLDRDLAEIIGVPTKVIKQAVRRNGDRFPEDFMFELGEEEND